LSNVTEKPVRITEQLVAAVCQRLAENKRVRRQLPHRGRLHIDRLLPFICVYRRPAKGSDPGTDRLVTSEASYVVASSLPEHKLGLTKLLRGVTRIMGGHFGAFLLLEIWADATSPGRAAKVDYVPRPAFRLFGPTRGALEPLVESFRSALSGIQLAKQQAVVTWAPALTRRPPDMPPIMSNNALRELDCTVLGLAVSPVYRHPKSNVIYPIVLRQLQRQLTNALRRGFYKFVQSYTKHDHAHFHMLGRRAVVRAVWDVDEQLEQVARSFDTLLQITPVNAYRAWNEFKRNRFEKTPVFRYRPLPADPVLLKRKLYDTPIERVEDPTLQQLFREKQDELDRRITLVQDINTPNFVHGSIQLFGGVEDELLRLARHILAKVTWRTREESAGGYVNAQQFAARAEAEIAWFRHQWPAVTSGVEIRGDVTAGLMVSCGRLLISRTAKFPSSRVDPLLQHEVGTHVLTHYNGWAQPFKQLGSGLAGYEPLQEGLAVLAEYLTGGISRPRLRLLAARVAVAKSMLCGATFIDAFRELHRLYNFPQRIAYYATMRTFRGGGFTKDAMYLRGLCQVLEYLKGGAELEPLLIGKIGLDHVPLIRELQWRGVLKEAPLRPRYLDAPQASRRLGRLKEGLTVMDLLET
jgi:uncharacterized protein (TIGR02421 family)